MPHVFWLNRVMMVWSIWEDGKIDKRKILTVSSDLSRQMSTGNLKVLELEKSHGGNTRLSSWVCGKRATSAHGLENHAGSCLDCWSHSGICSESLMAPQCSQCIWQCFPPPKKVGQFYVHVHQHLPSTFSSECKNCWRNKCKAERLFVWFFFLKLFLNLSL